MRVRVPPSAHDARRQTPLYCSILRKCPTFANVFQKRHKVGTCGLFYAVPTLETLTTFDAAFIHLITQDLVRSDEIETLRLAHAANLPMVITASTGMPSGATKFNLLKELGLHVYSTDTNPYELFTKLDRLCP